MSRSRGNLTATLNLSYALESEYLRIWVRARGKKFSSANQYSVVLVEADGARASSYVVDEHSTYRLDVHNISFPQEQEYVPVR